MPFTDEPSLSAPLSLPNGFDLNPEVDEPEGSSWGAAFRLSNPIASAATSYSYDPTLEFDPDYEPFRDIQGTEYENYSERFYGAHNATEVAQMKAQIDRELADRRTLDAAGGWGFMQEMVAGLLSPTSILPGGAVVKGLNGIRIGRTAMNVSVAAGAAAAIDELFLQGTQQTRTGEESAYAIGGSMILGGLLGAGAGKLTSRQWSRTATAAENLPQAMNDFNEALEAATHPDMLRGVGAERVTPLNVTMRREAFFKTIDRIPLLRGIVRSDPILRAQLSDNVEVRRALVGLTETPLQYLVNETGQSVTAHLPGGTSAETAINLRRNTDLASSLSTLKKAFGEYTFDGPVGLVGRFTAPVTARFRNLTKMDRKLTESQFMEEVGRAAMSSDTHPIPQVANAAKIIRERIFNKVRQDAIDAGIFDPDMQVKFGESYFMRVYNTKKISAHMGDGSANDIKTLLTQEFQRKRRESQERLQYDSTVRDLEGQVYTLRESARQNEAALNRARRRAEAREARAQVAIKREGAVARVTEALRRDFGRRADDLSARSLDDEARGEFEKMVRQARNPDRVAPPDFIEKVRDLGGLRDDGSGELQEALDTKLASVKRSDRMARHADDMREAMVEAGYLPENATLNDFWDALRSSANGEKIFSSYDRELVDIYEGAVDLRNAVDELGVDIHAPYDEILDALGENAGRSNVSLSKPTTRARAGEARRSARKAEDKTKASASKLDRAIDRLQDAAERLKYIDEVAAPNVRKAVQDAVNDLKTLVPELKEAKKAQSADEYYVRQDDSDIQSAVDDAVSSLLGLKPGEHSYSATLSSPTRARALDVADDLLAPWLETDMSVILQQYFQSIVPDIEIVRRFGDLEMTSVKQKINDEMHRMNASEKNQRRRLANVREAELRVKELENMRDRIRGIYGAPADPKDFWVRGLRVSRTLSYTGYLGGMTLSALPDVAGVVGRNGIEAAFGSVTALTDPKRLGLATREAMEDFGAAAEWHLNSRAVSMADIADPYGANTRFERGLGQTSTAFSFATGMIPWNAFWKSVGTAVSASKILKAAVAFEEGRATKGQLIKLAENGIDTVAAQRIAKQAIAHSDRDGLLWIPQGKNWDDPAAFQAMQNAMTREMNIMVVTPGQDKPLAWSSETGKFFSQFKTFAVSAHHRVLLSGMQRADASVLAQVTTAIILGGLVSNIKADLGGYERKEGAAFWEDAIDRAGIAGWLFEAHGIGNALAGGRLSISGEETSRYMDRSALAGILGPSVDMAMNAGEAMGAMARGNHSYRDVRKLMRPVPGNNLPYLLGLFQQVEDAITDMTGGKARP